jgi:hypothetical protein
MMGPQCLLRCCALLQDLLRFNRFFIDKEEDSVIKLQALSDRIKAASSIEQLQALKAELVDFHGERRGFGCGDLSHITAGLHAQQQQNVEQLQALKA